MEHVRAGLRLPLLLLLLSLSLSLGAAAGCAVNAVTDERTISRT